MSRGKNGLRLGSLKYMLELTSRCNLRCGMCPMDVLTRPFEDAPFGMVEDVARQMKDLKLPMRYLHEMGEPFLYKRLPEAIDLFPGVCVSTNATLLDEAWAKAVLSTSLSKIRLCIDTLKPDVYPIVRKGGRFDVVVENIRRFLELSKGKKIVVEIQRMITTQTHDETVKDFRVLDHDLSVESGELTPSMKVRRKVVESTYRPVLDSMYPTTPQGPGRA